MMPIVRCGIACFAMVLAQGAGAQDKTAAAFPGGKPITIVVAYAPGAATDVVARLVAQQMTQALGTSVVIENKPGAGGNIGAVYVKRAAPDGYTVLGTAVGFSVNTTFYSNPGYDAIKDFVAVAAGPRTPNLFTVRADSSIKTVPDMLSAAKAGKLTYSTSGLGTTTHLSVERLLRRNRVEAVHVPEQPAAAVTSVLGGHTEMSSTALLQGVPHVRSGKLRGLAVTSKNRSELLPEVPTLQELGYAGFDDYTWTGFFVPAGTPQAVVDTLNRAVNEALRTPEARKALEGLGMEWQAQTPAEFHDFVQSEVGKWGSVVKQAGIKAN